MPSRERGSSGPVLTLGHNQQSAQSQSTEQFRKKDGIIGPVSGHRNKDRTCLAANRSTCLDTVPDFLVKAPRGGVRRERNRTKSFDEGGHGLDWGLKAGALPQPAAALDPARRWNFERARKGSLRECCILA